MGRRRFTRRQALETAGVAALGGVLGMASSAVAKQRWARVSSPTGKTIHAVEHTSEGLYACANGGEILARRSGKWKREVKKGPTGNSRSLLAADTTSDEARFWVVGASGAIGEYRPDWKNFYDHSNPLDISSTFTSISVAGPAEDEQLRIGKGSGEVLVGSRNDGGGFDWSLSETGAGTTVESIDFSLSAQDGFAATAGGEVYRTRDGCQSWRQVGVPNAETGYTAMLVVPGQPNRVYVGGGGGRIQRLDCDCNRWTPTEADTKRVYALAANSENGRLLGAGASGRYYEMPEVGRMWDAYETPTSNSLFGASPADSSGGVDVLVGGSGTILER